MKTSPVCGLLLILLLSCGALMSQTKVVLINEEPTRVEVADNEITAVQSKVPGYMNGYTKSPKSNFKRAPYVIRKKEVLLADAKSIMSNQMDIEVQETDKKTVENTIPDSAISDEVIDELNNSLFFDYGSAILSEENIKNLDAFAEKLKNRTSRSILLKSWFSDGDVDSQKVVTNRLNACRQYLETKGVASNIILTSSIGSNRESRFVTVVLN